MIFGPLATVVMKSGLSWDIMGLPSCKLTKNVWKTHQLQIILRTRNHKNPHLYQHLPWGKWEQQDVYKMDKLCHIQVVH